MAAYTLSAPTNIDALAGRTGADTVNTNGFDFTIDQDTRFGVGGSATTSFAAITSSATLGGSIIIDSTKVRYIPYTGGSGTVPAYNTLITRGGASGRFIAVQSSITATPTAPGSAMPASGIIKVKAWNNTPFAVGALSGITATASGSDVQGVIDVCCDVGSALTASPLGGLYCTGGMYEVGVTTGVSTSTYQLPTMGNSQHFAGVQVETAVGSNIFDWFPKFGDASVGTTATDSVRGKGCFITTAGVLRLGHNGSAVAGWTPPAGLRIRCASILLNQCATGSRATNAVPGIDQASRYNLTLTNSTVNMTGTNVALWVFFVSVANVALKDTSICDNMFFQRIYGQLSIDNVCSGVGSSTSPTTNSAGCGLQSIGSQVTINKLTTCPWQVGLSIRDFKGLTFKDCDFRTVLARTSRRVGMNVLAVSDVFFDGVTLGNGVIDLSAFSRMKFKNMNFFAGHTATTTTFSENLVTIGSAFGSGGFEIDGLSFPGGNSNPNGYIFDANQALGFMKTLKFRNFGTASSPLSSSSSARCLGVILFGPSSGTSDVTFQRVYVPDFTNGLWNGGAANNGYVLDIQNCRQSDSLVTDFATPLANVRAFRSGRTSFSLPYYPGAVFSDNFNSDTVGSLALQMTNTSDAIAPFISFTSGAGFTGANPATLSMPRVGQTATFEWPWQLLGHTGFSNSAITSSIALTPFTFAYQIDTGSGYSDWSSELSAAAIGTALNALGAIDPVTGFKFKLRITTATANSTPIPFVRVNTTTSAAAQITGLHPLETFTVTFTGLPVGTDAFILNAGTTTILDQKDQLAGTSYSYTYDVLRTVDIGFVKPGFQPFYIRNLALAAANSSIPVALVPDRNYQP